MREPSEPSMIALEHRRMQHGIVGGMLRTMLLQQRRADRLNIKPLADAQGQLALALQVFVNQKVFPVGVSPGPT